MKTAFGHIGLAESGGSEAMPIVFLHGVGSDKSVWQPQLDHFGRSRHALAFDYPGYGESDPAPEGATRDDYAAAILDAMTELGIQRAHLCGLSLGGIVAIALHHQAAQCCASLIIADSFASHPDGRVIYERSIAASADMAALAEARTPILLAPGAAPELHQAVRATMARIDGQAFRIGAKAVWLADQSDRHVNISVPTLILCGDQDGVTPPALSRELHERIPQSRLALIADAGHLTNIEQPSEFNRLIEAFLEPL